MDIFGQDAWVNLPNIIGLDGLVTLLATIFNDKPDWIGYYIYELDFGKKWKKEMVIIDKKDIKLKTHSDLYNLLTSNYNKTNAN